MSCPVLALATELIRRPSISPNDEGCQEILTARLQKRGFTIETLDFADTKNCWVTHGDTGPTLLFVGHTDVVPVGKAELWHSPPFSPEVRDGLLYGRGAADMKGSLAAMIVAAERFITAHPQHSGRLAFLITSDEESSAINGTTKVVDTLLARQEKVEYCLVAEPSSNHYLGDIVKNGRRGSLTADLYIHGHQGHVAYPQLADNPIHRALPALQALVNNEWDQGNAFFPPTSMQIANIQAGTGSNNVIPGELWVQFNFRFSPELTAEQIQQRVTQLLDQHQLRYSLEWSLSGHPFLTPAGELLDAVVETVRHFTGQPPQLLTTGGTSDGRFIARMGSQVVELGPKNQTIHQVNECVSVADLQQLTEMYQHLMQQLLP